MSTLAKPITLCILPLALSACAGTMQDTMSAPDVPAAVAVPAGNTPAMTLKGVGLLTYECRAKAGSTGAYEWVFAGPDAALQDQDRPQVGKYYGGRPGSTTTGSKVHRQATRRVAGRGGTSATARSDESRDGIGALPA